MKKIVLFYGYSQHNAGDMAITIGALDLLVSLGNVRITVVSRFDENSILFKSSREYLLSRYPNLEILPCPFILDRDGSTYNQLKNYCLSLLTLLGIRKRGFFKKVIQNSDLVFFNGGNLIRCSSNADFIRLIALFKPLRVAKSLGKKYFILPQSSAKINSFGRKMIGKTLDDASLTFVREELSYNKLVNEYPNALLHQSYDCALFVKDKFKLAEKKSKSKSVAITVRGLGLGDLADLPTIERDLIKSRVLDIAKKASLEGYEIIFVVQTEKDYTFTNEIKTEFDSCTVINSDGNSTLFHSDDPIALAKFYSNIDLLVGMRLHSIILAVSQGTPCYGVFHEDWGLKNPGFMNLFGLKFELIHDKSELESIDSYCAENVGFYASSKDKIETERDFIIKTIESSLYHSE
ncbi:polysaccharide pyruvyl transferase family protein [Shewanella algae]|uniref:polysaccharide pyruvyl transferase family protein n=1 Tax=Shewanella algae TaxID=38313 RepID=UPI0031F5D0FD